MYDQRQGSAMSLNICLGKFTVFYLEPHRAFFIPWDVWSTHEPIIFNGIFFKYLCDAFDVFIMANMVYKNPHSKKPLPPIMFEKQT